MSSHDERYRRGAREFYDVVTGLWDRGPTTPLSATSVRVFFSIPTSCMSSTTRANILGPRAAKQSPAPIQGWPVIGRPGVRSRSPARRRNRRGVFAGAGSLADGKRLYADIKGRMRKIGRIPTI